MVVNLNFKFPPYWQIYLALLLAIILFAAIKWRVYLIGVLAIFSILLVIVLVIVMVTTFPSNQTYQRYYEFGILGTTGNKGVGVRQWSFGALAQYGGLQLGFGAREYSSENHTGSWEIPTNILIRSYSIRRLKYPLGASSISLTGSWPFIEQTLGFQLILKHRPRDLNRDNAFIQYGITVPQWSIPPLMLIFPLIWGRRWLRKRYRLRHNLCLRCGFDRRAHQATDPCPECGTVPQPPKTPATQPPAIGANSETV